MPDAHQPGLPERDLAEVSRLLRSGELTAVELTSAVLARIGALDGDLHSFITVDAEGALAAARLADAELAAGGCRGPLHGIPVAVKDNLATRGLVTTFNSRALADWVPDADEPAVARLRAAGAVLVGKTNLNEFGWSLPSEADLNPPVRNPWNPRYASIGSSSGSGAAVAAGLVYAALGTDGGGSTRLPAGQHGLVGLKPTRGAVPRTPTLTGLSSVGVLARSAADTAAVYDAIADRPVGALREDVAGLRLGVPRAYVDQAQVEDEVAATFDAGMAILRDLEVRVTDLSLPHLSTARAATFVLITAGNFATHEDLLRDRLHLLGPITRRYALTGAFARAHDVLRAQRVRELVTTDLDQRLGDLDGVLTPVTPFVTAEAARVTSEHRRGRGACFTSPFNLTGWPAISIPAGHSATTGLPIGIQVAGRPGTEAMLLRLAKAYGDATGQSGRCAPGLVRMAE